MWFISSFARSQAGKLLCLLVDEAFLVIVQTSNRPDYGIVHICLVCVVVCVYGWMYGYVVCVCVCAHACVCDIM